MTKNDACGGARVGIYREIVPGFKLTARYRRALERAGSYPNPNRRPIVSDLSLFCYVNRLLAAMADISANSSNPVKA